MKLICLNAWGCRIKEEFFEYVKTHSESTDIFCFQEIASGGEGLSQRDEIKSGFEDLKKLLPDHTGYFVEYGRDGYYSGESVGFKFGIATFVRSNLKHKFVESIRLFDTEKIWSDYSGRFSAGVAMSLEVEDYSILNIHGMWQGSIKTDTEAKIEQSHKIINLADKTEGKDVICGDFNLLPHTKAIEMLGDKYTDLIQKYVVTSTRSSLYTKELRYSDYAFTDKEITVNDFSVPDLNISDHQPLELYFK
jgi:endonuclease/exonuclease/phosphatase family metal-dependent hydrolase